MWKTGCENISMDLLYINFFFNLIQKIFIKIDILRQYYTDYNFLETS